MMRKSFLFSTLPLFAAGSLLLAGAAIAKDRYEVTITNLTRGQQMTPALVASHRRSVDLFTAGQEASEELAALAENGNTAPLTALLESKGRAVRSVVTSSEGLLNPGQSVKLVVDAGRGVNRISVASMLIPTNDGFIALNNVPAPDSAYSSVTYYSPVYDAGSERNDELCASIPGPSFSECGGPGGGADVAGGEEGFVHIHAGIHGIGDLLPEYRDWNNPAAKITIRRLH